MNTKRKWHKNCGGSVLYKEGKRGCGFEQAGECQNCSAFPLNECEIIFEINEREVERFYDKKEISAWRIVDKKNLKERLEE